MLLGYSGRIARKGFALTSLSTAITIPVLMLLVWLHGFTVNPSEDGRWQDMPFYILGLEALLALLFVWIITAATTKRLHDVNFSGWWQILLYALPALIYFFSDQKDILTYLTGLQTALYSFLGLMPSKNGTGKY